MLVPSDAALDGKLDKKLFGKYPYIGEILTKQRDIYCAMEVQAPESTASLSVDAGM